MHILAFDFTIKHGRYFFETFVPTKSVFLEFKCSLHVTINALALFNARNLQRIMQPKTEELLRVFL